MLVMLFFSMNMYISALNDVSLFYFCDKTHDHDNLWNEVFEWACRPDGSSPWVKIQWQEQLRAHISNYKQEVECTLGISQVFWHLKSTPSGMLFPKGHAS